MTEIHFWTFDARIMDEKEVRILPLIQSPVTTCVLCHVSINQLFLQEFLLTPKILFQG
jgi:hypothetical protein